jgi:hypothetical protein
MVLTSTTNSDELVVVELDPGVEELVVEDVTEVVDVVVEELGAELVVVEVVVEVVLLDAELEGATTPQAASTSTKNESNAVFFICKIIPPN